MTDKAEKRVYELFENYNEKSETLMEPEDVTNLVDLIKDINERDSSINKVKVFMETFNQSIGENSNIPARDVCMLRLSLMLEELIELAEACGSQILSEFGTMLFERSKQVAFTVENKRETLTPNLKGALDALCDQRYVNDGTILAFGMHKNFEEAFDEVHESNMSKICKDTEEADKTYEKYKKEGIETTSEIKEGKGILILREKDKKVLKSINYKEADVSKFL